MELCGGAGVGEEGFRVSHISPHLSVFYDKPYLISGYEIGITLVESYLQPCKNIYVYLADL